ncbi:MAG: helix-turn-helix domain-containing protein [Kangiellaceae bacterium]|nr:helix-turn-helix domain-containing protein [Kangiellaceae bacterium]
MDQGDNRKESLTVSPKVAILTTGQVSLFELGCAVELFALPRVEIENWYQADVVSFSDDAQQSTGGIGITSLNVNNLDKYDLLIIPSWPIEQQVMAVELKAILKLNARGGKIVSFCSGAFLLGQLGLLDGIKSTTHWRYADRFKQKFKLTQYVDNVLYTDNQLIACSAGSSAAIDLGIEIIRNDFGYKIANQIARRLVLAAHRSGGQAQFVEAPIPQSSSRFSDALDWAVANINQKIDICKFAQRAHMTRRTFDRQFRKSLNMSAKEWITKQRLQRAKQLLETTALKIDRVAENSGFDNAISMRHNFRKYLQLSPARYRQQFSEG